MAQSEQTKYEEDTDLVNKPFDVVYTWVNDRDPAWQTMHHKATEGRVVPADEHASADDPARYTNRNELYWSIRSVHKYAPWVRRIHVLTNCAAPEWAKDMEDVRFVWHEEVFPEPDALPTFNAFAIETVLHRVPGISDRFLYFNDDFFLCRDLGPGHFFWGEKGVRYTVSPHEIPYARLFDALCPVDTGAINAGRLLERDFDYRPKLKLQHTPYPLSKRLLEEIEVRYPNEVQRTRRQAFRQPGDLAMATTMHAYYAECTGYGKVSDLRTRYVDIGDWRFLGLVHPLSPLCNGCYDTFCLNEIKEMRIGKKLRDRIAFLLMQKIIGC